MSITVYLSGHLKSFTGGETEVVLPSAPTTLESILEALWKQYPALRDRVLNEQGEIRQHVNVFVGSEDVKRHEGLKTKLNSDEIHIFNAVSGG